MSKEVFDFNFRFDHIKESDRLPQKIETNRLLIRLIQCGDGAEFSQAVIESRDELAMWLPWATEEQTPIGGELFSQEAVANFLLNKELSAVIIDRRKLKIVGAIQVHSIQWELRQFEIGYWIKSTETGQGYMTEAAMAVVNHLKTINNAERISITTDEENHGSRRLAERLDFDLEAVLRKNRKDHFGIFRNTCIYAWVKQD